MCKKKYEDETPDTKRCTACGELKGLEEFYKHPRDRKGRQTRCKSCEAKANRAKTEAKYAKLGRAAPSKAKAKKRVKHPKPHRADDYFLIVPDLIEAARAAGHPAFDNPELRNAAAAREVLVEKSDLVVWCVDLGVWFPATHENMLIGWAKQETKPGLKSHSRPAHTARQAKRSEEARLRNAAGATVTPDQKWCPSCCQTLPAGAFGVSIHNKDGLYHYCKACQNDRSTNRHFSKKHQTPPHLKAATASAWSLLGHVARVGEFLTGKKYHRDHVNPMAFAVEGETFLHQPSNLRLMEASANSSKGDRLATMAERLVALQHKLEAEYEGFEWRTADGLFSGSGPVELADLYDDCP